MEVCACTIKHITKYAIQNHRRFRAKQRPQLPFGLISFFYYTIFGHFLRMEVNKLKLWMSCYYRCRGKNRNALAPGQICIFAARCREFWAEIDGSELDGKFKELQSWKRKQQLVCERLERRWKCRKENAQTKNQKQYSMRVSPLSLLFHTSMWVSLSLSCLFLIFRNSAERRGPTSLCPKSFVLCASQG